MPSFHQADSSKYVLSDTLYELEEMAECDRDSAQEHARIAEGFGLEVNIGGWDAGVVS